MDNKISYQTILAAKAGDPIMIMNGGSPFMMRINYLRC